MHDCGTITYYGHSLFRGLLIRRQAVSLNEDFKFGESQILLHQKCPLIHAKTADWATVYYFWVLFSLRTTMYDHQFLNLSTNCRVSLILLVWKLICHSNVESTWPTKIGNHACTYPAFTLFEMPTVVTLAPIASIFCANSWIPEQKCKFHIKCHWLKK